MFSNNIEPVGLWLSLILLILLLSGNGVSIRAPFFEIEFSNLTSNAKTGFIYNPHYTSYEALQLRTGIHDSKVFVVNFCRRYIL